MIPANSFTYVDLWLRHFSVIMVARTTYNVTVTDDGAALKIKIIVLAYALLRTSLRSKCLFASLVYARSQQEPEVKREYVSSLLVRHQRNEATKSS